MKWLARGILIILVAIPVLAGLAVLTLGNWALFHEGQYGARNVAWYWLEVPAFLVDVVGGLAGIVLFFDSALPWLRRTSEWGSKRPPSSED